MKRMFLVFAITLLLSFSSFAQFTLNSQTSRGDGELLITWTGAVSTSGGTYDSLLSNTFSLEDYDGSIGTFYYEISDSTTTPTIMVDLKGSEDNSTFTTIVQILDTTSTETPTWEALNTLFPYVRAKYYKICIEQTGTGTANFVFKWRQPLKDPAVKN